MDDEQNAMSDWVDAVSNGETLLGFNEWVSEQNKPIVDPVTAMLLEVAVSNAKQALREYIRPLAEKVLGEWAADDGIGRRHSRRWEAHTQTVSDDVSVVFTVTDNPAGPNEPSYRRTTKSDFTGKVL